MGSGSKREGQPHGAKRGGKLSKTSSLLKAAMTKESEAQRQHPGLKLTNDRGPAHYGVITALHTSDDGLYLFSAGRSCNPRNVFSCQPPSYNHPHSILHFDYDNNSHCNHLVKPPEIGCGYTLIAHFLA